MLKALSILLACIIVIGYHVFFDDAQIFFECRKDTAQCVFFHTTHANKSLRHVKTYDISTLKEVVVERRRKLIAGRGRSHKYYVVRFMTNEPFELPEQFSGESRAQKTANKIKDFLSSDQQRYLYTK